MSTETNHPADRRVNFAFTGPPMLDTLAIVIAS